MPERTISWGGANSPYETHVDRDGNDRVILAEDTDGNTVLLEWDGAAGEWVYGGPVNMDGADVSNVGTLDANVIDTGEIETDRLDLGSRTEVSIESDNSITTSETALRVEGSTSTTLDQVLRPDASYEVDVLVINGNDNFSITIRHDSGGGTEGGFLLSGQSDVTVSSFNDLLFFISVGGSLWTELGRYTA